MNKVGLASHIRRENFGEVCGGPRGIEALGGIYLIVTFRSERV
jgi:hypothetical protein